MDSACRKTDSPPILQKGGMHGNAVSRRAEVASGYCRRQKIKTGRVGAAPSPTRLDRLFFQQVKRQSGKDCPGSMECLKTPLEQGRRN